MFDIYNIEIINIQIDVLVEFCGKHSLYIFNLAMLINNQFYWKHITTRFVHRLHCYFSSCLCRIVLEFRINRINEIAKFLHNDYVTEFQIDNCLAQWWFRHVFSQAIKKWAKKRPKFHPIEWERVPIQWQIWPNKKVYYSKMPLGFTISIKRTQSI